MKFFVFISVLVGTAFAAQDLSIKGLRKYHFPLTVKAVDELDLNKFVGRWYQIKESPVSRFLNGNTDCNTQDYKMLDNGTLGATWSGNKQKTSDIVQQCGNLYMPDSKHPGNLRLRLFGTKLPLEIPFDVIALSSQKAKRYNWAIITDTLNSSLFVVVRDLSKAKDDDFMKQINNQLEELGFNKPWNKPSNVKQGGNCKYPPEPDTPASFFEF